MINLLDVAQICLAYFRSSAWQKICNEVAVYGPPVGGGILRCGSVAFNRRRLGVWGQSPQPPEGRGPGGRAPSARKFYIFLAKIT